MAITAKQLAEKLGLSQTAVSLALNNKPGISEETKRRVIEEATKYGYDFSRIYGKTKKTGRIGLVTGIYFFLKEKVNTIFDDIIDGAYEYCERNAYHLEVIRAKPEDYNTSDPEKILMDFRGYSLDGIIVLGADIPKSYIMTLQKLSIPIVLIGAYYPDIDCCAVNLSNRLAGRQAAEYLCDKYLQEPGYLRNRYRSESYDHRILGFMEAVRFKAFSRHKVKVYTLSPAINDAYNDMKMILSSGNPLPRAFFAETDQLAIGAIKALIECGYRVPEDVAVMGFDNMSFSSVFEPAVTTMDYPKSFIGKEAARKLVTLINEPERYVTNTEIKTTLVIRKSA